jgi:hypothetical protein
MSKRPNSDQPTIAKRARKASGFRLAGSGLNNPVQSESSISSRFVTLSEKPAGRGLRAQNRLFHRSRTSEPSLQSKSPSNDAEFQVSDSIAGLHEAPQHEEVQVLPDASAATGSGNTQRKRKRKQKTYVCDVFIFIHI